MILQFVLENFRSVNDEQILEFYTTGVQGGMLGNTAELSETPYRALKSIGLYGANASGKTNVLRALWTLRQMIVQTYRLGEGDDIKWYDPCAFRDPDQSKMTEFEIDMTIPIDGKTCRFVYTLGYDQNQILIEKMVAYPKGRPAELFSRKEGDTRDTISLGATLKGGDRRIAFFKNQCYLSVAGNNAGAPSILRQFYRYFKNNFVQVRLHEDFPIRAQADDLESSRLVRFVDLEISDVEMKMMTDVDLDSVRFPSKTRYMFKHEGSNGRSVEIELRDESDGTQRLFRLFPQIVDVLVNGGVFIIDEIECGMHPFMAETLVRLFNDPEVNQGQAQIIFTTHNSALMSQQLLRRDQIWFSEKTKGCTRCYSLAEFDKKVVTPTSPFIKWYLEGRFGATPSIRYADLAQAIVKIRNRKEVPDAQ